MRNKDSNSTPARNSHWLLRLVLWSLMAITFPFVLLISIYLSFADIWDSTEKYDTAKPWKWWGKINLQNKKDRQP